MLDRAVRTVSSACGPYADCSTTPILSTRGRGLSLSPLDRGAIFYIIYAIKNSKGAINAF